MGPWQCVLPTLSSALCGLETVLHSMTLLSSVAKLSTMMLCSDLRMLLAGRGTARPRRVAHTRKRTAHG